MVLYQAGVLDTVICLKSICEISRCNETCFILTVMCTNISVMEYNHCQLVDEMYLRILNILKQEGSGSVTIIKRIWIRADPDPKHYLDEGSGIAGHR
jgi:hypothetical protein